MYQISIALTIYILAISFVFGTVFGSFVDCMAWRIVAGESVLKGRSHCDVCNKELGLWDLIPIVSYIRSKGKCNYCGAVISPESTCVEIFLGIAFAAIVYRYDVSFVSLRYMGLTVMLTGLSLVDLKTFTIPDWFHAFGIFWWLLTLPLIAMSKGVGITSYLKVSDVMFPLAFAGQSYGEMSFLMIMREEIVRGLISGFGISVFMLLMSLLFDRLSGKESLGGGDIKLLFVTGLYMSVFVSFFNMILSCIIGLLFVVLLRKNRIPFGPAISLATMISVMFGNDFINWYMRLLG
ncbi:prepilin peptidase [Oribacterium sp. WCC10]|uniref:prepilin peptidase n=1 Tax=Oribacterium sp. WCC10 TaxID=1855343 RepID=UPI0008E70A6A|nr:A24 family peptidase [Oribacterium sp. WCC10]SFG29988.1 leader peptidase (prepilin peptidase) / N-methyltransferase [Oribacterium sp. WCC10]